MKYAITAALAASLVCVAAPAFAADDTDNTFGLGQIVVTAPRTGNGDITASTVNAEAIYDFSRDTLDEAVKLIPGVTSGLSGNSRNERLIYVRGFDRYQVPLSIDGIRVYLPADNRLDCGRFLTPDVAEIQMAKGCASALDGPGAMGGAVNLVTREPTVVGAPWQPNITRPESNGLVIDTRLTNVWAKARCYSNPKRIRSLRRGYRPTAAVS
jgi:iron complex outermembrane receptor protein